MDKANTSLRLRPTLLWVPRACAGFAMVVGAATLLGLIARVPTLKSVYSGFVSMKVNTALAFLFAGVSLWFMATPENDRVRHHLSRVFAVAVGAISLAVISEYAFHLDFGIDEWLIRDVGPVLTSYPGRMSPLSAVMFLLFSAGLLTAGLSRFWPWITQSLALAVLALPLQVLAGYLFGAMTLYLGFHQTGVALHSGITFMILGMGLLFVQPHRAFMSLVFSEYAGGAMLRPLLPAALVVPLIVSGVIVRIGAHFGLYSPPVGVALAVLAVSVVLCGLVWKVGLSVDNTDRARGLAQEAYRKSSADFKLLADSIPELCWMAEADGHIFWYNHRWYEYTGTKPEDMEGWGWKLVHEPTMLDEVMTRWNDSIATGHPFEMEFPLRGADGVFRWFLTRIRPQKDESGKVNRWFGVNTDIDQLRSARQSLQQSQERLSLAQQAGQSGIFDWDIRNNRVLWNRELEEVFGLSPGGFGGEFSHWEQRVHPDDLVKANSSIAKSLADKDPHWRFAYRMFRADSQAQRWIDARAQIYYENEQPVRMVGIKVDVTERMEAERAFRDTQRKLERVLVDQRDQLEKRVAARTEELYTLNLQLREMSGSLLRAQDDERRRVARELHESTAQNLTAINLNLGFLRSTSADLDPPTARVITQTGALLDQVLSEVRTLSYLLHPPMLDEVGLAAAVHWFVDGFGKETGLRLKLEVTPRDFGRLPQDAETALFRVVQEALTNVYRHSKSLESELSLKRLASHVELSVQDHGQGMPGEQLEGDRLKSHTPGVGIMGMRERIRQLGGELVILSRPTGTRVEVVLPIQNQYSERRKEREGVKDS